MMINVRALVPVLIFVGYGATVPLEAQPIVNTGGIVNSASYAPALQPNAAIAQGSIFTVFGTGMGPATPVSAASFPLQTTVGGTSIAITSGTTTLAAIPLYVSANQLSAILPSATTVGTAALTVTYNGQTSAPVTFPVIVSNVGLYTRDALGSGFAVATDLQYQLYTPVYATNPGDAVTLWATGVGPVSGVEANGPLPGNLNSVPTQVWVGLKSAQVLYAGRSGCCAGLDQISFIVPDGIAGCAIPIAVETGGVTSNFGYLPVASGSRVCSNPLIQDVQSLLTTWEQKGSLKIGIASLTRSTYYNTALQTSDQAYVQFQSTPFPASLSGLPTYDSSPVGTCSVYPSYTGGTFTNTGLDAGSSLTLTGANGGKQLLPDGYGGYRADGASDPNLKLPLFLDPGSLTFSGAGGTDVAAFSQAFTMAPSTFAWTNPSSVASIDRSTPLTLTWTGATADELVMINGFIQNTPFVGGSFNCTAKGSDGQFTIPTFVLQAMPAGNMNSPLAQFWLTVQSPVVPFSAPGMDYGWIRTSYSIAAPAVSFH